MRSYGLLLLILLAVECKKEGLAKGRRQGRIVGGDLINIEQAPFNVALEYLNKQICGGAILNKEWVVTAAHCFGKIFLKSQALVRAGSSLRSRGGSEHSLVEIIKHPGFVLHVNDHDIALLNIYPPLTYSTAVQPISLPGYDFKPSIGEMITVYGWGYTKESGDPSDYLRQVRLPIFPHEECVDLYRTTLSVTNQMICAGYREGGKDACVLDSGGPMVWGNTLQGLVSWGWGCARTLHPGVFTDLSSPAIRGWILNQINI